MCTSLLPCVTLRNGFLPECHIAVAVAMGGRGALVTHNDQLRAAVKDWVAKPGPMVIDVRISRTVPSIPYRRVHYGRDE